MPTVPLRRLFAVLLLCLLPPAAASAQTGDDGIFATFRVSHGGEPAGEFTCRLFYDKAPLTVASFIGLAEGTRAFVDEKSGNVVRRPYFDGLVFHRIIKNFMIQGGCPRGDGTSGPGWSIPDEFDPSLRHDRAGMLSMANSGPHTGGSQFFVTAVPTTWLDDKHTIFGEVVDGLDDVVLPLNAVATGDSDRPVEPVVIESLTITRTGAAAQAFAVADSALATAALVPAQPSFAGQSCRLDFARKPNCGYSLLQTGDFATWSLTRDVALEGADPSAGPLDTDPWVSENSPRQFFRTVEFQYPPVYSPVSLTPSTVTLVNSDVTLAIAVDAEGAGTVTISPQGGTPFDSDILDTGWNRNPHGGRLVNLVEDITFGGTPIYFFDCGLRFTSADAGTFVLALQTSNRQDVNKISGTFTVSGTVP